jgi:pilus assembly protein Flp/PilA
MHYGRRPMTHLARRFSRCSDGATAIEYALVASGVALVIVTAVAALGSSLSSTFAAVGNAFP